MLNGFGNGMILFPRKAEDEVKKRDGKDKVKTKGDGINAALVLLKDLRDFQDKVETCIEAQDIEEYKQKIEVFNNKLDEMYEILLDIARGGMHANRSKDGVTSQPAPQTSPQPANQSAPQENQEEAIDVSAPIAPMSLR